MTHPKVEAWTEAMQFAGRAHKAWVSAREEAEHYSAQAAAMTALAQRLYACLTADPGWEVEIRAVRDMAEALLRPIEAV
jgi:hypothetical protein